MALNKCRQLTKKRVSHRGAESRRGRAEQGEGGRCRKCYAPKQQKKTRRKAHDTQENTHTHTHKMPRVRATLERRVSRIRRISVLEVITSINKRREKQIVLRTQRTNAERERWGRKAGDTSSRPRMHIRNPPRLRTRGAAQDKLSRSSNTKTRASRYQKSEGARSIAQAWTCARPQAYPCLPFSFTYG